MHMDEQLEFVKQIAKRLDGAGLPYMMTGSMAMAVYAVPRMTRDIDIVVEFQPKDAGKLAGLFERDCFVDVDAIHQAAVEQGMFNILHKEWFIKADFIIRKNKPDRKTEFGRRRTIDIEGIPVQVVAPEDLILSKLFWAKDSESELQQRDVRQMIQLSENLDWNYLDKWAPELGVAELLEKNKR